MKAREEKQRDIRSTKYSVQRETNKEIRKKIKKKKKKRLTRKQSSVCPRVAGAKRRNR